MAKTDDHPKWNYDEFLCYLMIYASHADMELTDEERALIRGQIDEDRVAHLFEDFNELTDYERIQVIQAYKGLYYPNTERKEEILHRLKSLFQSDGDFSIMERNLLRMLKKIM